MSTVLVVDDRPDDRALLSTVLRQMGYEPLEADSGQAALEVVARSESVDLVITDIVMPTMDGYDLVRELRAHPKTADIPVIFCTATYVHEEVRRLAVACGVDVILLKPFEPSDIVEAVEAVRAAPTRSSPPVATEEFYREHLRVLNAKLIEKVDQLAAAERRTAESLTLLETLQSTAPVGLGFVDREFRIRQMNESLASVNGLPVEQQLGRTVQEVVPELWDQIEPVYRDVLDNGRPVLNQEQHADGPGSTGNSRSWLASYYPVRLEGEIIGIGTRRVGHHRAKARRGLSRRWSWTPWPRACMSSTPTDVTYDASTPPHPGCSDGPRTNSAGGSCTTSSTTSTLTVPRYPREGC